jgi:hypothetical protein
MQAVVQSDARRRFKVSRCSKDMVRLQRCLYRLYVETAEERVYSCHPEKIHEINLRRADERRESKRIKNREAHLRCVFCKVSFMRGNVVKSREADSLSNL